ncbi:lytic transglycosylase domain-containing protein [Roseicyclus mahoneyensis]|uniref:Transglycosylase-like protein with SLT domain n=1 Tax=Roseicyclus mahoneyensis TaxID=164332 RepID=A0A316GFN9_9RHOB|nr:lytic transglycosylase domain-containing protein [Roseicyclus mahoneyensis]PWK59807.1 hypothetical protein C7455_10693 [Roseicyclus mahoneyensis]
MRYPGLTMLRRVAVFCLTMAFGQPAAAQAHLCDAAADRAAREIGVPLSVLRSLTRVETGRGQGDTIEPWPWTLNMGGDGRWHDSEASALAAARQAIAGGRRNIDIGCFQINYHWHGAAFADPSRMLDPVENARYAARFLRDLHAELGDWTAAAGAFHSRNPDHAARYLARYREISAALGPSTDTDMVRPGREAPIGPSPLSFMARPSLLATGRAGSMAVASPVRTTPARPLWEGL